EESSILLNFDTPFQTSAAGILDFDLSSGISSLESLETMLNTSPNAEDQVALQRTHYSIVKPFSQAHLPPFAKSRVEYSIEQLNLVPKMMVEQNGTPWMHSKLYDEFMPRSIQDAHAACALHITKNEYNAEHVTRYITNRVEELAVSTLPTAPAELLARAHALMLYQTMLVFSGDLHVYGQAEALISQLELLGNALIVIAAGQTDATGSLPLYPATAARASWKSFIFRESLRRTVLSLFQFTAVCHLLRGQLKACLHALAYGSKVTMSAHLWNAKNAFDFAIAWNERKHFLVKELDFTEVLRDADPDDVDIFAKMMLVGLQGIDDIKGWFYIRGGTL
ncbi:hypothetical protein BKA66DRAFT_370350, partial [Pyrenochaeta sp. MPI-SDFR-AT-0127]